MSFEEWKEYKVGDLYDVFSGLSKPREQFGFGFPFVNFKDVFQNYFLPDELSSLANTNEKERKSCSVKKGDIFLTRTSETQHELGMSAVALKDYENATFNGFTKRLRLKKDLDVKIDLNYIGYFLRSPFFRSQIGQHSSLTTRASLNSASINSLKILLPDLSTQKKIGKILKSLDDKIELNRQTNQTLEAIAQALFNEWFVAFNFPGATGEMQDSALGKIPKGWKVGKLGDAISNFDSKRIPLSSRERDKRKGNYPYYGAASIVDYVDDYLFDGIYLLMGEDGTVITKDEKPVLQFVSGKFWVNNHAHILKGKDSFSTEFVHLLLSNTNIKHLVTGAVQPKINQANMNGLKIIMPEYEVLKKFDAIVKPMYEQILSNEQQIQTLIQLRDSLLPKLMKGEIAIT